MTETTTQNGQSKTETKQTQKRKIMNRKTKCKIIRIDDIKANNNIRIGTETESKKFKALKNSIEAQGIVSLIVVKKNSDETYTIIDGSRRYLAAKELGFKKLKVTIYEENKNIGDILGLVANSNQKVLTSMELGVAYKRLIDSDVYTSNKELAKALGISDSSVGTKIKNLEMDRRIIEHLLDGNGINDQKVLKAIRNIKAVNETGKSQKQWDAFNHIADNKLGRNDALEYIKSQREPEIVSERTVSLVQNNMIDLHIDTSDLDEARRARIKELIEEIEVIRQEAVAEAA